MQLIFQCRCVKLRNLTNAIFNEKNYKHKSNDNNNNNFISRVTLIRRRVQRSSINNYFANHHVTD